MLETIRKEAHWYQIWRNLASSVDLAPLTEYTQSAILAYIPVLLKKLIDKATMSFILKARDSTTHGLYPYLVPVSCGYFNDNFSAYAISLIFRARGSLLNINARAFKNTQSTTCPLCNLGDDETIFHIIGICPIYKNIRYTFLGEKVLDLANVINLLNGSNFVSLFKFLKDVIKYRDYIVNDLYCS